MASVNWLKCKTANEAKSLFHHDEKEKRSETKQHSNPHIDKTRTHLNFSCVGRSYDERCKMYDDAVAIANSHEYVQEYLIKSGKRAGQTQKRVTHGLKKDAVTCLGLLTYAPAELSDTDAPRWFTRVHEIMCDMFGADNVIDTDVHMDEQHEYTDPVTYERVLSRNHAHTMVLPMTADGRMCAKEICNRANMVRLNNAIEDMSQREFGMAFNTGEYAQRKSVEQLKGESLKAENELLSAQISALADVAEKAPKKRKLFARGEQYVMSKEEHDEYMQMVAEMRTMSQAALATEEDRKAAAKARRSAERMRREAEQMKKQEDKLIQERAEQLAKQAIGKAQEREREAEQMRETYREQFKAIVQDPFEEFKKKIEDKQHMQEMANKIKQSIDDLQLQTGLSGSRRIIQAVRDGVDEISRK